MKLIKSKKGFFTDPLVDAFSFIAIVIVIVIFSVIFQLIQASGKYDIKGAEMNLDAGSELLSILRTPIEIDGYKTDIAGYIIYAKGDSKKIAKLSPLLEDLIDDIIKKTSIECIDIEFEGYKRKDRITAANLGLAGMYSCSTTGVLAETDLPSSGSAITVKLWLKTKEK
jgi:hypothetical protein